MNRFYFLTIMLTAFCSACGYSDNEPVQAVLTAKPLPEKVTLFGQYKTKPPKELFYADQRLKLNTDSTFYYACITCTGVDSSSGTWSAINDLITLTTSDRIKKLHANRAWGSWVTYLDLTKQYLIVKPRFLLWMTSTSSSDTLIRE